MLEYAKLRIIKDADTFDTGGDEVIVLPLSGSCTVTIDGERFPLTGRESVFSAVTDFAYAPRDAHVEIVGDGRFALPAAPATRAARSTTSLPSRRSSATR